MDNVLLDRVLELSAAERAELVRRLILSLESEDFDADAEEQWAAEIDARLARMDAGQSVASDWREVIDRVRGSLKREKGK